MNNTIKSITFLLATLTYCAVAAPIPADSTTAYDFQPLGKLVDIGGRSLQIDCRGTGSPTVVFEAGLGNSGSMDWSFVHDAVAKTTRACAYSRAGIMWSEPHVAQEVGSSIAEDLHTLLAKAGETGPFVMVGHSIGGPYTMIFTQYFPTDVAGLVFVDASHPDQTMTFEAIQESYHSTPFLGKTVAPAAKIMTNFNQLQTVLSVVLYYAASSEAAVQTEFNAIEQTLAEAGRLRQLANRPIIVLSARAPLSRQEQFFSGITPEENKQNRIKWKLLQTDLAAWSSNSQHVLVPDAGHFIHIDRPDVVIKAVKAVVKSVRTQQPVHFVD